MHSRFPLGFSLFFAGLVAIPLTGCDSGGPELGSVSGVVTVDDRPLPDATVEFQPPSGSPSMGLTDSFGKYKLMYTAKRPGAMLGKHLVRITLERANAEGSNTGVPQPLPAKYNRNSELTAEVTSGSNKIDFALKSK